MPRLADSSPRISWRLRFSRYALLGHAEALGQAGRARESLDLRELVLECWRRARGPRRAPRSRPPFSSRCGSAGSWGRSVAATGTVPPWLDRRARWRASTMGVGAQVADAAPPAARARATNCSPPPADSGRQREQGRSLASILRAVRPRRGTGRGLRSPRWTRDLANMGPFTRLPAQSGGVYHGSWIMRLIPGPIVAFPRSCDSANPRVPDADFCPGSCDSGFA